MSERRTWRPSSATCGHGGRHELAFPLSDQEQRDDPAATLAVGIGLYVLTDLFERLDNFIEAGLSVGMVLTYFVVKMPLVISQILPVIFLLSTVIQLCIMARSRELTALQAGGISLGVVANSMILCGIFWGGVQLGFSEYLGVGRERESARIWQEEVRKKNLAATVLKDVWFTDGDWIVSLGTLDPQAHGTGFSGYELSDDGLSIKRIVQASTFTAEPNHWALQDVRVYTPDTFTQEQEPDSSSRSGRIPKPSGSSVRVRSRSSCRSGSLGTPSAS